MSRQVIASIVCVVALFIAASAQAAVFVEESFLTTEYIADADLVGQNGGVGFTGNWTSSDLFADSVRFEPRTTGLSHPGWPDRGGAVEHFRTGGPSNQTKTITHDLDYTPTPISGSNVQYFGFLFNTNARFTLQWTGGSSNNRNNRFIWDGEDEMVMLGGGQNSDQIRLPAAPNQTHLLLLRISDLTVDSTSQPEAFYDAVELWIDPDLSNLGPADGTGNAIISKFNGNNNDIAANELTLTAELAPGEAFMVDEIFLANDLNDILAVPTPSSGLLALVLLPLMIRRRA